MKKIHLLVSLIIVVLFAFVVVVGPPVKSPVLEKIGGDRDQGGCLIGAGYSWCETKKKCLRVWEEECQLPAKEAISRGLIKTCQYPSGEEICGPCYCLESEKGCLVIDISVVGDLKKFVDQEIVYEEMTDITLSPDCPRGIKLMSIDYLESY